MLMLSQYYLFSSSFLNFETMEREKMAGVIVENHVLESYFLKRDVKVDCYLPSSIQEPVNLLLIKD